ncbi:hypothetical protein HPB49_021841 [Dermacentor silvarum]|uniref:Uncharacterized protein n=1 Tax=Dermacentor silvarum TaxID=543639 RepID=A0ACB8DRH2_DERSI|nr:hypothetical protein HPB49_021841 [Dermacentor silvarum]
MKRATVAHILLAATLTLRSLDEVTGAWFVSKGHDTGSNFICGNDELVRPQDMCNGVDNCGNNEDEEVCSPGLFVCPAGSFTCRNKMRCVPADWVCDGENDCRDAVDGVPSDEQDCATATEVTTAAASAATTSEPTTRTTTPPLSTVEAEPTSTTAPPGACNVDQGDSCLDYSP